MPACLSSVACILGFLEDHNCTNEMAIKSKTQTCLSLVIYVLMALELVPMLEGQVGGLCSKRDTANGTRRSLGWGHMAQVGLGPHPFQGGV